MELSFATDAREWGGVWAVQLHASGAHLALTGVGLRSGALPVCLRRVARDGAIVQIEAARPLRPSHTYTLRMDFRLERHLVT